MMLPATIELKVAVIKFFSGMFARKLPVSPGPVTAIPIGKPSVGTRDFNATTLLEELEDELEELEELELTELEELLELLEYTGGVPEYPPPPPPQAANKRFAAIKPPHPHLICRVIVINLSGTRTSNTMHRLSVADDCT